MSSVVRDLSIFNKFNFKMKPVGIKFLLFKPDGIEKLDKNMSLCEMMGSSGVGPFLRHAGKFYLRRADAYRYG